MELDVSGAKIFYEIPILGGIPITETLVNTWLVMAVIVGLCIFLTRGMAVRPTGKRQIVAEYLVKTATNFVEGNMGKQFSGYVPFISAIFVLSALCSLSSLLGLYAPTSDLSTLLGWALLVFVLITYTKVKTNGVGGYFVGYTKPIAVLTPFNIISEIATPVSMAFRHFGNIASGSVITALVYAALTLANHALFGLLPGVLGEVLGTIPFLAVGLPAVLSVYFDLFSSCLQAFIFCMLTMMYIASAASED
ncbi:MAG: F0F1 ATP synthase subunit A [Oscillospiraceae bacterium]|nr:F0F1 ATP synthase subunit A [Oscillospiraceae bacterium]